MSYSITGKTAIVTGAANGVGLAIARHFVEKGAHVMCVDIDEARLEAEFSDYPRDEGPVRFFTGDVCQKLTMANLISATVDAFDRIDILVNASRQVTVSDPLCADDTLDEMLRQNLTSGFRLSQMVAKRMIAQAEDAVDQTASIGTIVNLSTIAGQRLQPDLMAYSIAVAALDQATRAMAVALAPRRIRVNAVAFGSVMSASLQAHLRENEEWRDAVEAGTPLGRIGHPGEIVEAVQFLASDAASFVTGQVLTVDGGRTLIDPVAVPAH